MMTPSVTQQQLEPGGLGCRILYLQPEKYICGINYGLRVLVTYFELISFTL